jgi:putative ABC transport system permease protein
MMVMIRVKDEMSYDKFHPQVDRTYRILSEVNNNKGDKFHLASTPLPLKQELQQQSNVIDDAVQVYPAIDHKGSYGDKLIAVRGAFTGPSFFNVFGFRLAEGNKQTALQSPNSIVLSNGAAEKFFGDENAIGKVLTLDKLGSFVVTGVLKKNGKSHIDYDVYASASSIPQLEKSGALAPKIGSWDSFELGYTYILLNKNATQKQLTTTLNNIVTVVNRDTKNGNFAFRAQPLNDIRPSSMDLGNEIGGGSDWAKVWTEIGVALLILIAACFNYTNLTIARALTRAKEVGIRKVAGAVRMQIFMQYIIESIVIALFALALSHVFLQFILEYKPFNDGYEFVPIASLDFTTFLLFLLFALITGAIAGAAPAWILSAFKPVQVLKNIATRKLFGNISMQRVLIVFQFSLSLVIIIFLSAFYRQFSYMAEVDTGFRKDNIVTINLEGADPALVANEIKRLPGVENVTAMSGNFGRYPTGSTYAWLDKSKTPARLNYYYGDASSVPAMGLQLIAGANLPANTGSQTERFMLVNETAAKAFGFSSNADAINKMIWLNDSLEVQITGVIKDFYYQGAGNRISPMAVRCEEGAYNLLNVHTSVANDEKLAAQLESGWKKLYPGKPFSYYWLGKQIDESNRQNSSVSLLGFLAFMTICIASLGLLGLVIYTVETRRKEISIRKVIGASVQQLTMLLSKGFIKLLLVAGCIAMPLGYVLSFFFLQNFANRISFGAGWLLLCFAFLLAIGLFTIISQTWKAAAANPVEKLKVE